MVSLEQIFSWFSRGLFPTQDQYQQTFSSLWHKSEKLPQSQILGLNDELDKKANTEDVVLSLLYLPSVPTRDNLYTTYPNAKNGEASLVEDEGFIYQFRSDLNEWVKTPFMEFPEDVLTASKLSKNLGEATDVAPSEKAVVDALNDRILKSDAVITLESPSTKVAMVQAVKAGLPEYKSTKNLFNKLDVLAGFSLQNNGSGLGWVAVREGWGIIIIKVKPNTIYTLSGYKERQGLGFFKEYPSDSTIVCDYFATNLGTFTTNSDTYYIAINVYSDVQTYWNKLQLEEGSEATEYEVYRYIPREQVEGLVDVETKVTEAQTSAHEAIEVAIEAQTSAMEAKIITDEFVITKGSNLLDPNTVIRGQICSPYDKGVISSSVNYSTSEKLRLEKGKTYTGINQSEPTKVFRFICFFDANDKYLTGIFDAFASFVYHDWDNIDYCIITLYGVNTDFEKYGIFKGENPVFEKYKSENITLIKDIATDKKELSAVVTIKDIYNVTGKSTNKLKVNITGNRIRFIDSFNRYIECVFRSNNGYTWSDVFNYVSWSYNGYGTGVQNGDDVSPIHILGTTIGANHGQPLMVATVANHGLTQSDTGTEWLDEYGNKFYLMAVKSDSELSFLSENKGTEISPQFDFLSSYSLTNSSTTLTITKLARGQLYNSIKNLSIQVLINGNDEVLTDGDYTADYVNIVETYDIINPASLLKNTTADTGRHEGEFNGAGAVRISNVYQFQPNLTTVIPCEFRALRDTEFMHMAFAQAIPIAANNQSASLKYYVPNSLPVQGYDFRKPINVLWGDSIPTLNFAEENWKDNTNPVNRAVQIYGSVGFALGFLKEYGVGKALQDYTNITLDLRYNTGKVYPRGVSSAKVGNLLKRGQGYSAVMYRAFIDMSTAKEGRMWYYNFNYNNIEYLYVDYSASMEDVIQLSSKFNDKKIEVMEFANTKLNSATYKDGVSITATYVEEDTCYIVLKIY